MASTGEACEAPALATGEAEAPDASARLGDAHAGRPVSPTACESDIVFNTRFETLPVAEPSGGAFDVGSSRRLIGSPFFTWPFSLPFPASFSSPSTERVDAGASSAS
tara:strand:+ start:712 stop:1032 length:321 start_codon:yes stop_codon:yes gene_type:complete